MSLVSVYDVGTITVTKGSTAVSGSGTAWGGAGLREGDMLWCQGLSVRILSCETATGLTLAHPWPGVTGAAQKYEVHYKPDVERSFATEISLLERLKDTALTSFTNLDKKANDIPIFTGVDSMGVLATTENGRSFLNQLIMSIAGSNIVTSSAARVTGGAVQGAQTETTAGKLLRVGSFGLGAVAPILSDFDKTDNSIAPGFYGFISTTSNKPAGATHGCLLHLRRASTGGEAQIVAVDSGTLANHLLFRTRTNSSWSAWKQITA